MTNPSAPLPRRDFLGGLAFAGAALAAPVGLPAFTADARRDPADWDHHWLKQLKAKHRTFFDTPAWNGGDAFGYPGRYLDAMRDGYGAPVDAVLVVIGLHGATWPLAVDDERWNRYQLGKVAGVDDVQAKARSLAEIQKRGAMVLVCNNSMRRGSRELAAAMPGGDAEKIYTDLRAGVLANIVVVPAMIAAAALAQEHGCSYIG
ncbi:MAG: hypothetical protein ABIZ70_13870 [Gemmatimonadales bacterium]